MGQKHRCFEEEVSSRTKMLRELVFIRVTWNEELWNIFKYQDSVSVF